mmetsp:Transcript_64854/g.171660  ORF Transcript_64854/g.171660 Transcript_64854/m.171660 type:complete len:180 (-) Transcript_64854:190-729(-)
MTWFACASNHVCCVADDYVPFDEPELLETHTVESSLAVFDGISQDVVGDEEDSELEWDHACGCEEPLHVASGAVVNVDADRVFRVILVKREGFRSLGVKIQRANNRSKVRVTRLAHGLVLEWNATHPDRRVQDGDILLEVNGVCGPTSSALTEKMRTDDTLELVFVRVGSTGSESWGPR